jgi:protein-S-isoprenylcysteine O-methyltransferase Ste14
MVREERGVSLGASHRWVAASAAIVCHVSFLAAIAAMLVSLWNGMQLGVGPLHGAAAFAANLALLLQFPLLHSWLLRERGRRAMAQIVPGPHGRTLTTTTFATIASWQLLATFMLWSPSGVTLWEPHGPWRFAFVVPFAAAWLFLVKALSDGGLALQSGALGWRALWRGERPRFGGLPTTGTFALCRQPIYFGFALTLWTGPVWTLDHLFVALVWSTYCLVGPLAKERRFAAIYGDAFAAYRERVPYFLPRLFS